MHIINLTPFELADTWIDGEGQIRRYKKDLVNTLLTFSSTPFYAEILCRAENLALIAKESGCKKALIAKVTYLSKDLIRKELDKVGIESIDLYDFSLDAVQQAMSMRLSDDKDCLELQVRRLRSMLKSTNHSLNRGETTYLSWLLNRAESKFVRMFGFVLVE